MIDLKQKYPHDMALSFIRTAFATACQYFRGTSEMGFDCSGCDMLGRCRSRVLIILAGSLFGLARHCVCVVFPRESTAIYGLYRYVPL